MICYLILDDEPTLMGKESENISWNSKSISFNMLLIQLK